MNNELEAYSEKTFENIKHIDNNGNEYWEARELQQILGYKEWRYFSAVIEKAQNTQILEHIFQVKVPSEIYEEAKKLC